MSTFLIHTDQLPELAKLIAQNIPGLNFVPSTEQPTNSTKSEVKDIMDVDGLREFLPNHPSRSAIYGLTHRKRIPFHKPTNRHIYFIREEIEQWISEKRSDIPAEFLVKPKQGRTRNSKPIDGNGQFSK